MGIVINCDGCTKNIDSGAFVSVMFSDEVDLGLPSDRKLKRDLFLCSDCSHKVSSETGESILISDFSFPVSQKIKKELKSK